jgi:hypothetical protein
MNSHGNDACPISYVGCIGSSRGEYFRCSGASSHSGFDPRTWQTIAGEIRSVIGNEFILDDGTGQIIVDGGPLWYHEIEVWENDWVTVVGVYDDYDFDAF